MKERIKNLKDYNDFKTVFKEFTNYPFYELWTEELFMSQFEYLKKNGEIFGLYLENGDIVGLITMIYGAIISHPLEFKNRDKTIYISDIVVLNDYRGKGYGSKLVEFLLDYIKVYNYYNEVYLRTNLNNSMSEGIFVKHGFEVIKNDGKIITQDVSFKRVNKDVNEIDTRKFLSKRLVLK